MSFKQDKSPRKPSIGVALCRRDPDTKIPQVLLVRSRITYSFSGFVFGKYKPWDVARLTELLGATTSDEKLLIWSCDFSKLWYHVWLKIPEASEADSFYQFYINSRTKFEKIISRDNGRKLRLILSTVPSSELGWDIPGGKAELKPDGEFETELETAQREMCEEAGVASHLYHILHDVYPICDSFEDDKNIYVRKYYVAWTEKKIDLAINYHSIQQIGEVSKVQWYSLREMPHIIAQNRCLHSQVRKALKLFKRRVNIQN